MKKREQAVNRICGHVIGVPWIMRKRAGLEMRIAKYGMVQRLHLI